MDSAHGYGSELSPLHPTAVMVMLDMKPDKKPDPDKPGARIDDW
jgi:hypothetical protein